MKLLICTDGSPSSVQTADLITLLKFLPDTQITILGVIENSSDRDKISSSMDIIEGKLSSNYAIDKKIRNGNAIKEILSETLDGKYDLVAVGGGGKQLGLLHPQLGSTTSNLARKIDTHFLVARNVPRKIQKILICTGAEAPASKTMTVGGKWISNIDAQIGLLHVLPREDKQTVNTVKKSESSASDRDGKKDLVLIQADQQLREVGNKNISPRIRQGLVVEQILNELSEGQYELLVIGAHYQPGQDRWQGILLDDVTDQLLKKCTCSVLIV